MGAGSGVLQQLSRPFSEHNSPDRQKELMGLDGVLSGDWCEQVRLLLQLLRRLTVGKRQDNADKEVVSETESGMLAFAAPEALHGQLSDSGWNRRLSWEGRRGWEVVGSA